jgi:hypothetical protein
MTKGLGTIQIGFMLICFMLTILGCQNTGSKTNVGGDYNGVVVKAEVDHDRLEADKPIHIKVTVTNTGNRVAVIESSDTPVFDILIP